MEARMYGDEPFNKGEYQGFIEAEALADECVSCKACLSKCP
ncbi:MAG: hypothetical protein WCQ59_02420 [Candidatus Cloacimonadaceae bacterium]|nr:hypothetical protein [Candidatus Cloacimonadota bacterium]